MNNALAIIRQRYQLTFPYSIRKIFTWLKPEKVIKIKAIGQNKLLIEPYQEEKKVNWSKIWKSFEKIQKAGNKFSAVNFVIQDRNSH